MQLELELGLLLSNLRLAFHFRRSALPASRASFLAQLPSVCILIRPVSCCELDCWLQLRLDSLKWKLGPLFGRTDERTDRRTDRQTSERASERKSRRLVRQAFEVWGRFWQVYPSFGPMRLECNLQIEMHARIRALERKQSFVQTHTHTQSCLHSDERASKRDRKRKWRRKRKLDRMHAPMRGP